MQDNGILGPMVLVEPKDTWEEAIQEQQYNHTDASQFSLTPSLLRQWVSDQDIAKGIAVGHDQIDQIIADFCACNLGPVGHDLDVI